jgi:hypothetical protein
VVVGEPVPSRHRRRERRRAGATPPVPDEAPREYASAPAVPPADPVPLADPPPPGDSAAGAKRKNRTRRADTERGLRGIVGAGPSQVGVLGAMRARDAAKPTAADLAEAEREVAVVRRHYVPPDSLPGAR